MRIIPFLLIGIFITGVTTLSSCKKEKKIERNLWKNGGEWNIESLVTEQVSASNPSNNSTETVLDCGTFNFEKDGTGKFVILLDGSYDDGTFDYSNTEDELTLTIFNNPLIFDLAWEEDNLTFSLFETYTSGDTYSEVYSLKKKT